MKLFGPRGLRYSHEPHRDRVLRPAYEVGAIPENLVVDGMLSSVDRIWCNCAITALAPPASLNMFQKGKSKCLFSGKTRSRKTMGDFAGSDINRSERVPACIRWANRSPKTLDF